MNEIRGVRKKNVIKIIQSLVKQGGCTKNELAFYSGLSLSTIDSLLEEMLKSNLVIKAGYREFYWWKTKYVLSSQWRVFTNIMYICL